MPTARRVSTEHPEPFHYYRQRGFFLDSSEMYLRVLFELEEEGDADAPARTHLTTRLGLSRPAVSDQLDRLVRDGDVVAESDRRFTLTASGRTRASSVVRRHRLTELLLVDVIGLPWELAHLEASRWQHVLTPRAEAKLATRLGAPTTSPFGCPIPGDVDPDRSAGTGAVRGRCLRLVDAAGREESTVRLRYVPEHLQTDSELLRRLREVAVVPGTVAVASPTGLRLDEVRLETAAGSVTVGARAARGLLVETCPYAAGTTTTTHGSERTN